VRLRLGEEGAKEEPESGVAEVLEEHRQAFLEAMDDDFNTPRALAALHELAREVNRWLDRERPLSPGSLAAIDRTFRELGGQVLGIIPEKLAPTGVEEEALARLVEIILSLREEYRKARDWARADALRDRLAELGIMVEDRPEGPTWRLER